MCTKKISAKRFIDFTRSFTMVLSACFLLASAFQLEAAEEKKVVYGDYTKTEIGWGIYTKEECKGSDSECMRIESSTFEPGATYTATVWLPENPDYEKANVEGTIEEVEYDGDVIIDFKGSAESVEYIE